MATTMAPDPAWMSVDDVRELIHAWEDAPWSPDNPDGPVLYDLFLGLVGAIAAQRQEITELRAAVAMQTGRVNALASIWTALAEQLSARQGIHCTTDEPAAYRVGGVEVEASTDAFLAGFNEIGGR